MLSVLIVDEELVARAVLTEEFAAHQDLQIVGQADTGRRVVTEAAKYEADAKGHATQAGVYQSSQAIYQNAQMFSHCDALTKSLNAAAQDARALAAEHRKMAGQAKK